MREGSRKSYLCLHLIILNIVLKKYTYINIYTYIYICFYRRFIFLLVSVVSLYTNNQKNNKNFILN